MTLPTDADQRKQRPIATGCLDYFPDALAEVANASWVGNEQHNLGEPLHWAKEKSTDEADCLVRHLIQRGTYDSDGVRHTAKVAWRALALLQREIEADIASESGFVISAALSHPAAVSFKEQWEPQCACRGKREHTRHSKYFCDNS